jgi:glycosyltransferase involved in cell wall biosynthesis
MPKHALRLHLSCGNDRWEGWVNIDRQPGPTVDLVCEMQTLHEHIQPGTCEAIHLMHAINYLTLWEARAFFATCRSLLRPCGELVIETVDAAKAATRLLEAMGKDFAAYLEGVRAFPGFGLDHLQKRQAYTGSSMAWTPWHMQEELRVAGFATSHIRAPKTHSQWRDFRCEAFVAAAEDTVSPVRSMQLLFVVDEEAGHVTANLRARLFVEPLARRGIYATVMDVRQYAHTAIMTMAARADVVIATKVRSLALLRQLKAVARGPVLFDFTDALWLPHHQDFGWQDLHATLAESDALLCDNEVIAEYARRHNPTVYIWPVCSHVEQFDVARQRRAQQSAPARPRVRLGWVGSRGTAPALHQIAEALATVARTLPDVELRVLGCEPSAVPVIAGMPTTVVPSYDEGAMIEEVADMDIGLFPAPISMEDYRNRGPLKGLIYMSAGVPMVCQRGGVLDDIVEHGITSFTASGSAEWAAHLIALASDATLRVAMGLRARASMDGGSLEAITYVLCGILDRCIAAAGAHRTRPSAASPASLVEPAASKPRILILADVPGWIFERHARTLQQRLADQFEIVVGFHGHEFSESDFDLIYPLEYNLVPPHRIAAPWKYVTSLRSHISWDGVPPALLSDYLSTYYQRTHMVSQRLFELFEPHLPDVAYVTHGIDMTRFAPVARSKATGAPLVVGWAGNRASPAKGFDEFIRPLADLAGVELVMCGFSDHKLGLDEMPGFYAALDVYVCSSSTEGNNNSLLEAAASGCAIVTTDNGTVPEYLRDGEEALVVDRSAIAFRDSVIRLRDDPALRARLSAAATRAVSEAWSWDVRLIDYRAFLTQAIDARAVAESRMPIPLTQAEHGAVTTAATGALQQALAEGNRALASASVKQLVSLDPTNAGFRQLYRQIHPD